MVGKLILTLLVMVAAIVVIKQRRDAERAPRPATGSDSAPASPLASDMRTAAYLFLILMFGAGAIIYYLRWKDDHTVVTVSLYQNGQTEPVTYEVYKFQLDNRSFTTVDGIRIAVADNERMEITGLDGP